MQSPVEENEIVRVIKSLKADSEYFIKTSIKKDAKFSIDKPDKDLSDNEREIRWHINTIELIVKILSENEDLKNELAQAQQAIEDLKLANTILTDSVTNFNERLSTQEKNVSEYLDELNEEIIDTKADINNMSINGPIHEQEPRKSSLNLKPPTFEGEKNSRPIQFIRALREYINIVKIKDNELLPLLRTCLHKNAKNWLYLVDNKINNIDDFETSFRERFWNEPMQSFINSRFEVGKWNPTQKKSRVLYAQELIGYAQELELNMSEAELIKKIGRHFSSDRVIPTSIRMQNINTYGKLFDLLQESDNDDQAYKERTNKKVFQNFRNGQKSPNDQSQAVEQGKNDTNAQNDKKQKTQLPSTSKNYYNNNNNAYKNRNNEGSSYNQQKTNPQQIRSIEIVKSANKKQAEKAKKTPDQIENQEN